jgi:hypothetical protein
MFCLGHITFCGEKESQRTNTEVAETKGSTSIIRKPAIGYQSQPVTSTYILTTSLTSTLMAFTNFLLGLQCTYFPKRFPHSNSSCILHFLRPSNADSSPRLPWLYSSNTRWSVQITNFHVMWRPKSFHLRSKVHCGQTFAIYVLISKSDTIFRTHKNYSSK